MFISMNDFNSAIEELTIEPEFITTELGEKLQSEQYNEIFKAIEQELTLLYERMRLLEDVKNYCREYLITEIQEKKELFEERLKIIEQAADAFQDNICTAYSVKLKSDITDIKDRNDDSIPSMIYKKGKLFNFTQESNIALVGNVKKKFDNSCYNSSEENLIDGKPCRSFYILNEPVKKGVTETYEIIFKNTFLGNYLELDTVNCEVENLKLVLSNGETIKIDEPRIKKFDETEIDGVTFSLTCKNFYVDSTLNKNRDYDAFSKVDSNPYERTTSELVIHDIVAESDKRTVQRQQNDLIRDYSTWKISVENAKQLNLKANARRE